MLTDIFAYRYASREIWPTYTESERRLIVQTFRILSEQVCRYYDSDGKASVWGKAFWTDLQSRIAMELGLKVLSDVYQFYNTTWNGQTVPQTYTRTMQEVCENWALAKFDGSRSADAFVKERLSLVELAFRKRGGEIAQANAELPKKIAEAAGRQQRKVGMMVPFDEKFWREGNAQLNQSFAANVEELNARLRQAGCSLHYHNGFIQFSDDALITQEVEAPFWAIVADPKWQNVDTDMKEALDRRDTGGRDPAFYAARALESAIKIICGEKGWVTGRENGAANFIDKLASKDNAFIEPWESEAIKQYFSKVRNPLGHGPGGEPMPALTAQQTDWAIENAMAWIKSLVRRL